MQQEISNEQLEAMNEDELLAKLEAELIEAKKLLSHLSLDDEDEYGLMC